MIALMFQIELYNSMVEKEGTDGEKDVMKAYRAAAAAREEGDNADEVAEGEEVSSALIERVRIFQFQIFFSLCSSVPGISITSAHNMILTICNVCILQVDAMLQNLEQEIDDVDAKIGDRWRLLDRFVIVY